jgi:mannose-6-phosphate isomerase-like protein (cupin superfamily)
VEQRTVEGQRVVEDPVYGTRYAFSEEGGGGMLRVEMWVRPGGGVTPHVHPSMEERFRVREGRCDFLAGRKWVTAGPGEEAVVPPGTRHAFRNPHDQETHVVCEARPPMSLQGFLEDVAGLSRAGKLTRRGLPRPGGVLAAAVLARHYRDMVVLLMPPPFLQPALLGPLARLGERKGLAPGEFARMA